MDERVALPHMMAALGEMVMMTEIAEQQNEHLTWRTVLLRVINIAVMALGLAAVLWGAGTAALSTLYLPRVNETVLGHGVTTLALPIDTAWGVTVALTAFGMVACAGLPTERDEARALRGALGQGFAGVLVAGSSLLLLLAIDAAGFSFDNGCFYASCWPMGEQTAALAFPSVLAGLLMVVAALLVRRVEWWVRAVVPPLVWVAALVVQHAVWSPWLLPIFERPPS